MADHTTIDGLRALLNSEGFNLAKFAEDAGVKATTLYSFRNGDTSNLRKDTWDKVQAQLAKMYPSQKDENLAGVIHIWDHIPATGRQTILDLAKQLAGKDRA